MSMNEYKIGNIYGVLKLNNLYYKNEKNTKDRKSVV